MACSAQQCASWTLKALGKTDSTSGHWIHTVQSWFVLLAGETLVQKIGNQKLQDLTVKKE